MPSREGGGGGGVLHLFLCVARALAGGFLFPRRPSVRQSHSYQSDVSLMNLGGWGLEFGTIIHSAFTET